MVGEKVNFAKLVRGMNIIDGAVLELDKFKKTKYQKFVDIDSIVRALENQDTKFLRNLSIYYNGISGIYSRFCKYMAGVLTYDWYTYPYLLRDGYNIKTVKKDMDNLLRYLDNLNIKTSLYDITYKVITEGVFYGYLINSLDYTRGTVLELPTDYCRSRYKFNGMDAVEFNVKYFDEQIADAASRDLVLSNFPKEFKKNYDAYKSGVLQIDRADNGAWFLCDPNLGMKFSLFSNEIPLFVAVIPTILNLEEAKQLDMKKTMQELLKIIIQKMPLDKNSEMVFDIDEAREMHNNACQMLTNAVNVDVLTTFADTEVIDLDSSNASVSNDPLKKVERSIFNEAGVSQMLFATDGNIALEKSIKNDEAIVFYLLGQYQNRLNGIVESLFGKRNSFKISMPNLSIYNIESKQKVYKEMATLGYSKLLPAIATGTSQSEFISLNEYENNILMMNEKMVPLKSSNTQSSSDGVGAPTKGDGELAEKTIKNKESAN